MDTTAYRKLARLVAWGRVGIGAAAVAAPGLMSKGWLGAAGNQPATRLLARTMAGRDLALGIGTLRALAVSDQEARPWVALSGSADAMDALATVLAFGNLPRHSRWAILAVTLGAALASTRAAGALDSAPPEVRLASIDP